MDNDYLDYYDDSSDNTTSVPEPLIVPEIVPEAPKGAFPSSPRRPRVKLPVILFVLTCLSTFLAGGLNTVPLELSSNFNLTAFIWSGCYYAIPLMIILGCHEAGHYLQAKRYGVRASLPFFIPMPISPLGTFGAVIGMEANMGNRRALFDIGITGPLAGLVPTLIFCYIGLSWSSLGQINPAGLRLGEPLVFKFLISHFFGELPTNSEVYLHPMAFAGWVGLLVTSLNLLPIGQLDGGHILYALLLKRAKSVATLLLAAITTAVIWSAVRYGYPGWILMLVLIMFMGPRHPPTANDYVSLGRTRTVLGWLTLAFIVIGFTPMPFII